MFWTIWFGTVTIKLKVKEAAYWCCLLSVNQWRLEDELGNGTSDPENWSLTALSTEHAVQTERWKGSEKNHSNFLKKTSKNKKLDCYWTVWFWSPCSFWFAGHTFLFNLFVGLWVCHPSWSPSASALCYSGDLARSSFYLAPWWNVDINAEAQLKTLLCEFIWQCMVYVNVGTTIVNHPPYIL